MAEYRKCECHECHRLVPKPEARRITIERESGRSGGSYRVGKTVSFTTGRSYYRKQDVWLCAECFLQHKEANAQAARILLIGGAVAATLAFVIVGNVGGSPPAKDQSAASVQQRRETTATAEYARVVETPKPPASDKEISAIQSRLVDLGFLATTPTGTFGPKTRTALRSFKAANGLMADEVWDDATKARLFSKSAVRAPAPIADATKRPTR